MDPKRTSITSQEQCATIRAVLLLASAIVLVAGCKEHPTEKSPSTVGQRQVPASSPIRDKLRCAIPARSATSPDLASTASKRLLQSSDLTYRGAFRLPAGRFGASTFDYGATVLCSRPGNDSLFVVGHDYQQAVAEIQIPALKNGPVKELNTAKVLQGFREVRGSLTNQAGPRETFKIGGLMVVGTELIGSGFVFYDADGNQMHSHFRLSSLDLDRAKISGCFQLGTIGGGRLGGGMAEVPAEHRAPLGTTHVTGQGCLPIISRTNYGPAAYGFDPNNMDPAKQPVPLVAYPQAHPLRNFDSQNDVFNGSTNLSGMVFPRGYRSLLFFGDHGTGPLHYGEGAANADPERGSKGYHAYPYRNQVWAYDVNDLASVHAGARQPWEVRPYDVWPVPLPYGTHRTGGVAYDGSRGRIYVAELYADDWGMPVIHAFDLP